MTKKYIKSAFLSALLLVGTSCELDLLDNPNEVPLTGANPDFVINGIQVNFASFFENMSEFGMDNTRMLAMFGSTYENAYQSVNFDVVWSTAYSAILSDAQLMEEIAAANPELDRSFHLGVSKFFKAYTAMTLVDYFGDIPYTESLNPDFLNPAADDGAEVYEAALVTLEEAIGHFSEVTDATFTANAGITDLYYDGDVEKWLAACNTLKLRAYLQTRLVNESESAAVIADLLDEDLIDTDEEALRFEYSSASISGPDARHPWFSANYITGGNQYLSNSYMKQLYDTKGGFSDPRLRYYFYRQTLTTPTDVNVLDCIAQEAPAHYSDDDVFCSVTSNGYFGRDHLDDDGIPPDNLVRPLYGVYPAGGAFDRDAGVRGTAASGLKGQGILPMLMPSFTYFMRAEAALELGTGEDPRALLDLGMRSSINYVMAFGASQSAGFVPTTAHINAYVNAVLAEYDAATDKLDVIVRQYWVALWGNGIDAYNTYRRTGKPENLQPALSPEAGTYYRSFTYPSVYVNRNNTAVQKDSPAVQVFWDVNPPGYVD